MRSAPGSRRSRLWPRPARTRCAPGSTRPSRRGSQGSPWPRRSSDELPQLLRQRPGPVAPTIVHVGALGTQRTCEDVTAAMTSIPTDTDITQAAARLTDAARQCRPAVPVRDLLGTEDIAAAYVVRSEGTRLNSSHMSISYAVFCLKKKNSCRC